jgi:hypothetical protein
MNGGHTHEAYVRSEKKDDVFVARGMDLPSRNCIYLQPHF